MSRPGAGSARHLLSIADLGPDVASGIEEVMALTDSFVEVSERQIPKVPALRGRTVVSLFFEDSTRTRLSFETAAKRLSADTMNFSVGTSSVKKGESLRDTVETIEAMGVDAIVVRHASSGVPRQVARWADAAVINAGDGWHEHPTQALLDALTIRRRRGSVAGQRVVICGDILHSRVARSNMLALTALAAEVRVVAPSTLMPPAIERMYVTPFTDFDEALEGADVVMMLRVQNERMAGGYIPSTREFHMRYGLTPERLARAKPDALVMHPGPMNRGVEIDSSIADHPERSAITEQVEMGVAVRMACLDVLTRRARGVEGWA